MSGSGIITDLHTHSMVSDGSLEPAALVRAAHSSGINALSLTDHDSTGGLHAARLEAEILGMEFINGCELSTFTEYGTVDLLGYYVPVNDAGFEARLASLRADRTRRNAQILQKLTELGLPVNVEELVAQAANSFGRPHIARVMCEKGYVSHPQEAFDRYLGRGKPAFAPKEPFLPEDAVRFLTDAGASAFIAHPLLLHAPFEWLEDLVRRLIPHGLTGLEAYHSEHDARGVRNIVRLANKYNLLVSGGSDFHGRAKPHITLARGKGSLSVPETVLRSLKKFRHERGLPV